MVFAFRDLLSILRSCWAKKLIFTNILLLIFSDSTNFNCTESLPIPFVHARTPHIVESPAAINTDELSID